MADSRAGTTISGLVPMIHVADIDRSIVFYGRLGFAVGNRVPRTGPMHWAWLYTPAAADWKRSPNLMLTLAGEPVVREAQAVLFYLYAADLVLLRERLLAEGLNPGPIEHPEYLPDGEFCLADPDGYTLMIAQSTADTP